MWWTGSLSSRSLSKEMNLTREQIEKMEAGRVLDELIDNHIFNKFRKKENEGGILLPYECQLPDYSTDIAAAWQVVEKLEEKHTFSLGNDDLNGRYCFDIDPRYDYAEFTAYGATAPLAICRCALMTLV